MADTLEREGVVGLVGLGLATNMVYYREIAAEKKRLGKHSTRSILDTIEVSVASAALQRDDIDALIDLIVASGRRLRAGGATHLAITSNTAHVAVETLHERTGLPVIDLRDAVLDELTRHDVRRLGMLSTSATARYGLYEDALRRASIDVEYPSPRTRQFIDDAIFRELIHGNADGAASQVLEDAITEMRARGCDAVALACTDMTLVHARVAASDVIDTTLVHARAIANVGTATSPFPHTPTERSSS